MPNLIRHACLFTIAVSLTLGLAASCNSSSKSSSVPTSPPVTTRELDSGNLGAGAQFSHPFANAGTYHYHCNFHGVMTGTVQVSDRAPSSTASVSITSSTTPFPAATVRPGGTVTWTNNTTMTHTVTSD